MKKGFYIQSVILSILLLNSFAHASENEGLEEKQPAVIRTYMNPSYNFELLKLNPKQVTQQDIEMLWPFRYLKGVDGHVLQAHAKKLGISLDDSSESRNIAWRIYFACNRNYANNFEGLMFVGSVLGFFVSAAMLPSQVPEGGSIVYGVFSRVACGGEFGPICPSTELTKSLPRELVLNNFGSLGGLAFSGAVNSVMPLVFKALRDRDESKSLGPFPSIRELQKYIKKQESAYKDQQGERMTIYFLITTVSSININSLFKELSGRLVGPMIAISESEYASRVMNSTSCYQLIDRVTALPCNLTLPESYLKQKVEYFVAGAYTYQAVFIDLLPYLVPVGITLLRYVLYVKNWF